VSSPEHRSIEVRRAQKVDRLGVLVLGEEFLLLSEEERICMRGYIRQMPEAHIPDPASVIKAEAYGIIYGVPVHKPAPEYSL
jgi:hypothetical protein